jgi:prepilin-type N-terminal cleavage/methylation domain-containing protein
MVLSPVASQTVCHMPRRRGLTLIELIVVLMVLVALAGVLIPMLPSMLTRAHVGAHTTNVTEATKLILSYQATNNGFPDQWDSLTNGTTLIDYIAGGVLDPQASVPPTPWSTGGPPGVANQAGGVLTASAVTPNELIALNAAAITKVHNLVMSGGTPWDGNPFDPTFDNYANPPTGFTTLAAGSNLAYIDPVANPVAFNFLQNQYPSWSRTARYVALGIGPRCTMIGKMATTAPVHFSDTPDAAPEFSYGRFVAIFKVSDPSAPGGVNMAQLAAVAALHSVGPTNLDSEFQNWYQLDNGGS